MARNVARIKRGFYPLPDRITNMIADNIQMAAAGLGTLLDPFAGQGAAAIQLCMRLLLTPYLVEIDAERAEICERLATTLAGPSEFLEATGGYSVVLFNPPYDYDDGARRLEINYWNELKHQMARPEALFIGVIPRNTLVENTWFARDLWRYLDNPVSRMFPQPEFNAFRQIVIFGRCRAKTIPEGALPSNLPGLYRFQNPYDDLRPGEFNYELSNLTPVKTFALRFPDWTAIEAEVATHGAMTTKAWIELQTPNLGQGNIVPAERLGKGHAVAAVMAGLANGLQLGDDIIKGRTRKYQRPIKNTSVLDDGRILQEEGTADAIAGVLSLLNTETFAFQAIDEHDSPDQYQAFVTDNLVPLATHIDERYPARFTGDVRPYLSEFRKMHAPRAPLPGRPDAPLQVQYEKAAGLIRGFDHHSVMILVGDMGVGKTTTGLIAMVITAMRKQRYSTNFKIVVWCPGHLIYSTWQAESLSILREYGIKVVIIGEERRWPDGAKASRPLDDVRQAMAETGPTILVLSNQTAKNGTAWEPRAKYRKHRYPPEFDLEDGASAFYREVLCPTCGAPVVDEEGAAVDFLPRDEQWHCQTCGGALFTEGESGGSAASNLMYAASLRDRLGLPLLPREKVWLEEWRAETHLRYMTPPSTVDPRRKGIELGFRRFPVAEFLNQHYAGQYYLMIDEAHETKGGETDIGFASQDLMAGARRTLLLTGTPYGGYATTIFYILHRSLGWFRQIYKHDDVTKFVDHYGLWRKTKTKVMDESEARASRQGYRRDENGWRSHVKELPGAHPGIAMLLAPISIWFTRDELDVVLPKRTEKRLPVGIPSEWDSIKDEFEALRRVATKKEARGFSAYAAAALGHLDRPDESETFTFADASTGYLSALSLPAGETEFPKVAAVCDLIADRWVNQGRRSIIFAQQVHRRDPLPYFVAGLKNRGLNPFVLTQSVPGPKRSQVIAQAVARGANVMLCNGKLVQTGLTLTQFSAIWRIQPTWSPYDELQQDDRIYRLGQTEECETIWVYWDFERSMQAYAVNLMAKKMRSISHVGGKMARGLAATDPDGESFMDRLMQMAEKELPLDWGDLEIVTVTPKRITPAAPAPAPEPAYAADRWGQLLQEPHWHVAGPVDAGLLAVMRAKSLHDLSVLDMSTSGPELLAVVQARLERLYTGALAGRPADLAILSGSISRLQSLGQVPITQAVDGARVPAPEPAAVTCAVRTHAIYTLVSTGRGVLTLKNGGAPVSVAWLGGDKLSGAEDALLIIRKHFGGQLAKSKPTKKWLIEKEIAHGASVP